MSQERRHYQRLQLAEPLDGWFGDYPVRLIDVSATGALIETSEAIPSEARALLRFHWRGDDIEILAETVRIADRQSGLHFLEETEPLTRLIADAANETLRALEANARGDHEISSPLGKDMLSASGRRPASNFVRWTLSDTEWTCEFTVDSAQPESGFTISAGEPDEEVALLCRTYESGDKEARRMTRLFAELSVARSA